MKKNSENTSSCISEKNISDTFRLVFWNDMRELFFAKYFWKWVDLLDCNEYLEQVDRYLSWVIYWGSLFMYFHEGRVKTWRFYIYFRNYIQFNLYKYEGRAYILT